MLLQLNPSMATAEILDLSQHDQPERQSAALLLARTMSPEEARVELDRLLPLNDQEAIDRHNKAMQAYLGKTASMEQMQQFALIETLKEVANKAIDIPTGKPPNERFFSEA